MVPVRLPTALGLVGFLVAAAAAGDTVPIWIANPGAPVALEVPMRVGVPFPRGVMPADTRLTLRRGDGERLPVQTTVVERWSDGSSRWIAVDAVVRGMPAGRSVATLEPAPTPAGTGITVDRTPPITIRSARMRIVVHEDGVLAVRLLGTPAPDLLIDPIRLALPEQSAGTVDGIEITSAGPVRAELALEHTHPGGVTARTDVVAWADSPTLLLRHRVLNAGTGPAALVRAAAIALHLPGVDAATALVDGTPRAVEIGAQAIRLAQPTPSAATRNGEPIGSHLDGAINLTAPELVVTAVVPDFWQQFPKAFSVSTTGLTIDLFAGATTPIALGIGAAKTHETWLRLERPTEATALPATAQPFLHPPRAIASPGWTRSTRALPGVIDPDTPAARAFLSHLRSDALRYEGRSRHERWDAGPPGPCSTRRHADVRTGFYGVLDWGDWNFPGYRDDTKGCDAWGNLEYDLPLVFGLAWASTGDATWGEWFERALRHYRDVDVIHAAPAHPDWVGLNHPHKVGHFDWRARGTVDLGHVWLEGLLLHGRLTGDPLSRRAALAMAERLGAMTDKAGNPRHFGWPMTALAAAVEATDDATHRTALLRYAERALARFAPDPAAGDWKIGILASGMAAAHRATGDDRLRDWLVRYGAELFASEHPGERDPRYLAVTGYLAAVTGDDRYAALASTLATNMAIGTWGKTLAMHGRVGFEALSFLPPNAGS